MEWFLFCVGMGILSRLAGNGFGAKWHLSWLPELLFALPFGIALTWALDAIGVPFAWQMACGLLAWAVSYLGMQSGTWMFLQWTKHEPNRNRGATLKPAIDWLAGRFGYQLGDEGYSWIAAGVKGFIIGLPVGGLPLAILWPLGYEIGSHATGRVERIGIHDPQSVSEFSAGFGAGVSIFLFVTAVKTILGL